MFPESLQLIVIEAKIREPLRVIASHTHFWFYLFSILYIAEDQRLFLRGSIPILSQERDYLNH